MEKNFREWIKEEFKDYGSKAISYINRAVYDKLNLRGIENKDITEEQYKKLITHALRQQVKKIEEQDKKEQIENRIKKQIYESSMKEKLGEAREKKTKELTERYEASEIKIKQLLDKTDDTEEDVMEMVVILIDGICEIKNMNNRKR